MASIGVDYTRGKRALSHDLPLVPFIDFLLCIVAFLLVTAVWSKMSRLDADALAPAQPAPVVGLTDPVLHIEPLTENRFRLSWKDGGTVVAQELVRSRAVALPDGSVRYPELAEALKRNFRDRGVHRSMNDMARDRAVLHTPNDAPFAEVVAVLDAAHAPERTMSAGGTTLRVPAFAIAFATD